MPVGWADYDALAAARATLKGGKTGTKMGLSEDRPIQELFFLTHFSSIRLEQASSLIC